MSAVNRIDVRLAALASTGRKALVPFVTAGDPSRGRGAAATGLLDRCAASPRP